MLDDSDFNFDELEFSSTKVEYYDIEINSPITDEDIRYAQLEEIIFKENVDEFRSSKKVLFPCNPTLPRRSIN